MGDFIKGGGVIQHENIERKAAKGLGTGWEQGKAVVADEASDFHGRLKT